MSDRFTLLSGGIQASALVLGHLFGVWVHYPGRPPSIYTTLAYLGGALMLAGILHSFVSDPVKERSNRTPVCVACLIYGVGVVLFEPFLMVSDGEIIGGFAALVPQCLAIGYLVHGRAWIAVAGVTLFLFTCSAMLASNLSVWDGGSGFFSWWTT